MSKRKSDVTAYGAGTSGEFDMLDFDAVIVHASSPTAVGNLVVEETLDGGTTWIQAGTVATAIGVAVRLAVNFPTASRCRFRFSAGNGTLTRVQRVKQA